MRSISARDWVELCTGRRIGSWRISLVSLSTSAVAAIRAALREAAVVAGDWEARCAKPVRSVENIAERQSDAASTRAARWRFGREACSRCELRRTGMSAHQRQAPLRICFDILIFRSYSPLKRSAIQQQKYSDLSVTAG